MPITETIMTLYRLLRDDESPLKDGITAKRPHDDDPPWIHIRYGSRQSSQWISTSRELSAIDVLIGYKRKTQGLLSECRVVQIDEELLNAYARKCKMLSGLFEIMRNHPDITDHVKSVANICLEQLTTKILDFNDKTVLDTHIPTGFFSFENDIARGYATRYKEVLVERFIPAECCIAIHNR